MSAGLMAFSLYLEGKFHYDWIKVTRDEVSDNYNTINSKYLNLCDTLSLLIKYNEIKRTSRLRLIRRTAFMLLHKNDSHLHSLIHSLQKI